MLETVDVGRQSIACYEASIGAEALAQVTKTIHNGLQGAERELVREQFLLPRLIADELRLCADLLGVGLPAAASGDRLTSGGACHA